MTEHDETVDDTAEAPEATEEAETIPPAVEPEAEEPEREPELEPEPELPAGPLSLGKEAYYAGDFEAALEYFEAVLADASYDEDSQAQADYWRAEALIQQSYTRDAVALFEEVAVRRAGHYLGSAAARRAEALRIHFDAIEGTSKV